MVVLGFALLVALGAAEETSAAYCYGATCAGQCSSAQFSGSRNCCCTVNCIVKPTGGVYCACMVGCKVDCSKACGGCNGDACDPAAASTSAAAAPAAEPIDSRFANTTEVDAALERSGYRMLSLLLTMYGNSNPKLNTGTLPAGTKALTGTIDTGLLPEPWRSLPETQNLVAFKAMLTVGDGEASATIVFEPLSRQQRRLSGKRNVPSLPHPVTVRVRPGDEVAEVTVLSPAEVASTLAAHAEACKAPAETDR